MELVANVCQGGHLLQHLSLHPHPPSIRYKPTSSLSFTTLPPHPPPSYSSPSTIASSYSSDGQFFQSSEPHFFQTLIPFKITRTIPTIAIAASALLFLRFHYKPAVITAQIILPKQEQEQELEVEAINELPIGQTRYRLRVQTLRYCKLQEGEIVRLIDLESNDYGCDWPLLKARLRRSSEWLESAKKGLNEVIAKDPDRLTEYSHVVDELIDILRRMEVELELCEKQNMKEYLRLYDGLLARVRKLEEEIFYALRYFQQREEEEN